MAQFLDICFYIIERFNFSNRRAEHLYADTPILSNLFLMILMFSRGSTEMLTLSILRVSIRGSPARLAAIICSLYETPASWIKTESVHIIMLLLSSSHACLNLKVWRFSKTSSNWVPQSCSKREILVFFLARLNYKMKNDVSSFTIVLPSCVNISFDCHTSYNVMIFSRG